MPRASPAVKWGAAPHRSYRRQTVGRSPPLSVSLTTMPTTTAYRAEVRYPGLYLLDGNTGGVCGRAERFAFVP